MLTEEEKAAFERSIRKFELVCDEYTKLISFADVSNLFHYQRKLEEMTDILICLKAEYRILNGS